MLNLSNNVLDKKNVKIKDYNKKIIKISETDIRKHKDFLKSELKKNFY
jgi:hypothetical protein